MADQPGTTRPKVFFSYSWTSPDHEARVLGLAKRLLADGVEVIIDKYDLQEGQDLHAFMERMVNDSTVTNVIVISDSAYAAKADGRQKGVGKEALIISAEVYAKAGQTKFIPVVFESNGGEPSLPTFMKGRIYFDMSTPEFEAANYEPLLRRLFGKPELQKPEIGKPPAYILDAAAIALPTTAKAQMAQRAVLDAKPYADAAVEDYFNVLLESLERFRVSSGGEGPLDERVMASINSFLPYRDEFLDQVGFIAAYRDTDQAFQSVFDFFESATRYLGRPSGTQSWNERSVDNFKFILGELFLHTIAILMKKRKFARARLLVGRDFRIEHEYADKWRTFVVLSPGSASIDGDRQSRLGTTWLSATAETLKQRATGRPATFKDLMEADLVLFLISLLDLERTYELWFPWTLVYAEHSLPLGLFARAESVLFFNQLRAVLGSSNKDEFVSAVTKAGKDHNMDGHLLVPRGGNFISWASLANLTKLATRP